MPPIHMSVTLPPAIELGKSKQCSLDTSSRNDYVTEMHPISDDAALYDLCCGVRDRAEHTPP